ncbi:unnamed protein product [Echinostoma caproni]|uniref:Saposin B-type domain-containing protein n=1 Tax=Echinostoma caproni TaxID=27848 RepID=A0A182ZZI3_9TREM|nr:unnamed protein product [Echinostoma caproni]
MMQAAYMRLIVLSALFCLPAHSLTNLPNNIPLDGLKSCGLLTADILSECVIKPLQKQKCDTGNTVAKYANTLGKLANKDLTALTNLCDACAGCKQSKKTCILSKLSLSSLQNCPQIGGVVQKGTSLLGKLFKK